jgi:hypothetical protein
MRTIFKVFGLTEDTIIEDISLCSTGLDKYTTYKVNRKYLNEFENEIDAIDFVSDAVTKLHYEHGYEIVKVYTK